MLHVGIDDTDSPGGMCTTYILCLIIEELKVCGYTISGYPRLIRLNPFAPNKTRGNGAVSFKVKAHRMEEVNKIKEIVLSFVSRFSELKNKDTNPGVVFYEGQVNDDLRKFALDAIRRILTIEDARRLADKVGAEIYEYKNGRGVIGALAAIGCPLPDRTYELIAYRSPENYGKKRRIDKDSVKKMDKETYPRTFDNIDGDYIAIEPHTPCPILYGIRGESPDILLKAHQMIKSGEKIERYCIFETNQHTDQHIQKVDSITQMEQFGCYLVQGRVKDKPKIIEGGHVFFTLKDDTGEIECAAYEPTKDFRKIVMKLRPGDKLKVFGGVGVHGTLNIEKMKIEHAKPMIKYENPICSCGKRMKSAGKDKGFKCPNCGKRLRNGEKIPKKIPRQLKEGYYEVPTCARRHLSKQLIRMGIKTSE